MSKVGHIALLRTERGNAVFVSEGKLVRAFNVETGKQLMVYGGHIAAVTCMTIHHHHLYTGSEVS